MRAESSRFFGGLGEAGRRSALRRSGSGLRSAAGECAATVVERGRSVTPLAGGCEARRTGRSGFFLCGDGDRPVAVDGSVADAPIPPVADASAEDANLRGPGPGACIADDLPCGAAVSPCVGDCQGETCCSRLCAGPRCSSPNVEFAPACPAPCGGDPSGTWRFVGACLHPECDGGGRGAYRASGALIVSADGSANDVSFDMDVYACGFIDTGGGYSLNGSWNIDAGTLGLSSSGHRFCVDGGSLWVMRSSGPNTPSAALHFTR